MSKLIIKDLRFEIVTARLEPFIRDREDSPAASHRFVWGVVAEAKAKDVADSTWIPSFTGESLLETKPLEIESWRNLAGRHGEWRDDDEMATLYTFSHEPIVDVRWRFELGKSGRLVLVLDGKSRFDHSGGYKGMLPVQLETELEYRHIPMAKRKEAACRKRLARFGIKDPFDFNVENGVSYMIPNNYPSGGASRSSRAAARGASSVG
jgi:hypothetical protein